jgi:hypothetical protein
LGQNGNFTCKPLKIAGNAVLGGAVNNHRSVYLWDIPVALSHGYLRALRTQQQGLEAPSVPFTHKLPYNNDFLEKLNQITNGSNPTKIILAPAIGIATLKKYSPNIIKVISGTAPVHFI